jgi:hypothetical protein
MGRFMEPRTPSSGSSATVASDEIRAAAWADRPSTKKSATTKNRDR